MSGKMLHSGLNQSSEHSEALFVLACYLVYVLTIAALSQVD